MSIQGRRCALAAFSIWFLLLGTAMIIPYGVRRSFNGEYHNESICVTVDRLVQRRQHTFFLWKGSIVVTNVNIPDQTFTFLKIDRVFSYYETKRVLDRYYPINGTTPCYYNGNNVVDSFKKTHSVLVAAIVFYGISFLFVALLLYDLVRFRPLRCTRCHTTLPERHPIHRYKGRFCRRCVIRILLQREFGKGYFCDYLETFIHRVIID